MKIKFKKNKNKYITMDYLTLIKLCQKYNIDYKNHYGKNQSYIKIKRKIQQYQNIQNKKQKENNTFEKHSNCQYFKLDNDEFSAPIKYYSFINKNSKLKLI